MIIKLQINLEINLEQKKKKKKNLIICLLFEIKNIYSDTH